MGSLEERQADSFVTFWGGSLGTNKKNAEAWKSLTVILAHGRFRIMMQDFPERIMTYLYANTRLHDTPMRQNPHYDHILTWLRTYGQAVHKTWQTDASDAPASDVFEHNLKKIFRNMSRSFHDHRLDPIDGHIWPWFLRVLNLSEHSPGLPTTRDLHNPSQK
jgi:hypothetical protein